MTNPEVPTVREYRGSLAAATAAFEHEAPALAAAGYTPVREDYTPGSWSRGQYLLAILLIPLVIGIVMLIYLAFNAPEGTLAVTSRWRRPEPVGPAPALVRPGAIERAAAAVRRALGDDAADAFASDVRDTAAFLDALATDALGSLYGDLDAAGRLRFLLARSASAPPDGPAGGRTPDRRARTTRR
ncbi:MAG: hypothetical protein QOD81_1338 [Solirubrobacteraceae bacterium]|nr:hypothetical protein [Solirubrobacteraceae bacterium]